MRRRWFLLVIPVAAIFAWIAALELRGREAVARAMTAADVHVLRGIRAEILLTPLRATSLGRLQSMFDVTLDGHIVLQTDDSILELVSRDGELIADRVSSAVQSFVLDGNDGLLTIRSGSFGQLEEDGSISEVVLLPAREMRLASSLMAGKVFLFGGADELLAQRLFRIHDDGTLDVPAQLHDRIVAVAEGRSSTFIATAHEIWRLDGDRLKLVFRFPESDAPITAIAVPPDERVLFVSNRTRTFALHGPLAIALVRNAGGALRFRGDTLYLWDARRRIVLALPGVENALLSTDGV